MRDILGNEPDMADWKNLYIAALEFKKFGCWHWMWDSDLFGVQNPDTGEIGYCCIMGRNKDHFALTVYLGSEGLESYLKIMSDQGESQKELFQRQKCIMASFENREFVDKQDFEIIKKLGHKFRGSNEWPVFRSYLPGYHPWHLTKSEAQFLTIALTQAIQIGKRFKKDNSLLEANENKYLVRVPIKTESKLAWSDHWLEPAPLKKRQNISDSFDKKEIEELKTLELGEVTWEIDSFQMPNPVQENNERPFYPNQILFADNYTFLVIGFRLTRQPNSYQGTIAELINITKRMGSLPKQILVKKEDLFQLLQPFTVELGIQLKQAPELPAIQEAKNTMLEYFT